MAHLVTLTHLRLLSDDEFAALKQTPAMSAMLDNRMRLTAPPGSGSNGASPEMMFEGSIRDWIRSNASSYAYVRRVTNAVDVYFRSKTDAAGFKMYWANRTWGD